MRLLIIGLIIVCVIGGATFAQSQDSITVGVASAPKTMNPHGSDADSNMGVMANIFEGLIKRTGKEGKIEPALATKWKKINPTTWRFWLRKGVKFHNGNDFTWEDVKFTYEHASNPEVSEFVNFGRSVESVTKVDGDPWVIDVKTKNPIPYFLTNSHQIFIMDKESTESRSPGQVAAKPIGTGPYKFVEWEEGSFLKMEAYDNYWGGETSIENVTLRPVTEASTRYAALVTGEIDLMFDVPVQLYEKVASNPDFKTITRPSRRALYLALSNSETPTKNFKVRKAMYMGISVDSIIEEVMFGHASPAAQIPDPPTFGYDPDLDRLYPYNPEKAQSLLSEAGYPDGFDITLHAPVQSNLIKDRQIAEVVVRQLQKIGINAKLETHPASVYWSELTEKKYNFFLGGWFDGAYSFTRSAFKLYHCPDPEAGYGVWNGAEACFPEIDERLEESVHVTDTEERRQMLEDINKSYMERIIIIPLHYQQQIYAMPKDSNLEFNPRPDKWPIFWEMSFK